MPRGYPLVMTYALREKIREDYINGLTYAEIMKRHGVRRPRINEVTGDLVRPQTDRSDKVKDYCPICSRLYNSITEMKKHLK